ncbi:hypothetical protein ABZV61_05085 [Streptomyces sp900116325]|uniref:Uncharacterized protein n=1 Tax=Streptomyces sp. 900116325 TaxID=3154295 RepID=A0ABV2U2V6_9ACTN
MPEGHERHPYDTPPSPYDAAKIEDLDIVSVPDGALPDREQMMDLRQMEVRAADAGGFAAAARRLHMIQSAVSSTGLRV